MTPRLKLVFDHLKAVRTLDEYLTDGGLEKDMQGLSNHLQQDLNSSVFRPAGWEDRKRQSNAPMNWTVLMLEWEGDE